MTDRWRSRLRRVGVPALWALRTYRGTAVLLAVAGGIGLLAMLSVASLHARLAAPPLRVADLGLGRGGLAADPNALRAAAVANLSQLLALVAGGVLCVTALSLLAVSHARARARVSELAVRRAVGASQRVLLAAALVEGGVVAAVALAGGGAGGLAGAHLARAAWPGLVRPSSGLPVSVVATLATVVGLILIGMLLPLGSVRRRRPLAPRSGRALELVVPAVQLGLSLTVLSASALLSGRAARLRGRIGSADGNGQVYAIALPSAETARAALGYADLLRRVKRQPGVIGASLTSPGAVLGLGENDGVWTDCGQCAWGGISVQFHPVYATQYLASADTFRMLGLRLVAGRTLRDSDDSGSPLVAVVSRSLAAAHFQQQQAVGRRIEVGHAPARWYTVVGVVADQLPTGFGGGMQPDAAVYLSVLQHPIPAVDLLVRTHGDPSVYDGVERQIEGSLGGSGAATTRVSESRMRSMEAAPIRWFGRLFGLEGLLMLAVATIGTFVVLRLWVTSLLHDLGVRRAVGARRRHLYGFVLRRAIGISLGGVALGCWCGMTLWGSLASSVAGLPAWDTYVALRFGGVLALAALAGALLPARGAARATPALLIGQAEG